MTLDHTKLVVAVKIVGLRAKASTGGAG